LHRPPLSPKDNRNFLIPKLSKTLTYSIGLKTAIEAYVIPYVKMFTYIPYVKMFTTEEKENGHSDVLSFSTACPRWPVASSSLLGRNFVFVTL